MKRPTAKEDVVELSGAVVNASLSYDVWWVLVNVENQEALDPVKAKFRPFFIATEFAHFVAMINFLYQVHESKQNTRNLNTVLARLVKEGRLSSSSGLEVEAAIAECQPVWKKVAMIRSSTLAHQSNKAITKDLMAAAELAPVELEWLVGRTKSVVKQFAAAVEILGSAAIDYSATKTTKDLMNALAVTDAH